jgi:hypothetical protein
MGSSQPRIGYACMWEEIPERSWSNTAWYLREESRLVTLIRSTSAYRFHACTVLSSGLPMPVAVLVG